MEKNSANSKKESRTTFLVECALMAAVLCVLAPIKIQVGPVPVTLSLLVIMLCGIILGWKKGLVSVLVYVLLGLCGVPVFSGGQAGLPVLLGPTGGYIWSYFPAVAVIGLLTAKAEDNGFKSFIVTMLACAAGTIVCYIFGLAQYMLVTKVSFLPALSICVGAVAPFDFFKLVLASIVGLNVKLRL